MGSREKPIHPNERYSSMSNTETLKRYYKATPARHIKKHILSTLAYMVGTFAVQATSHFAINREHYASVSFIRPEPIFALGALSMVLQGGILSWLYSSIV